MLIFFQIKKLSLFTQEVIVLEFFLCRLFNVDDNNDNGDGDGGGEYFH